MASYFKLHILNVTAELVKNGNKRTVTHVVAAASDDDKAIPDIVKRSIARNYDDQTSVKHIDYTEVIATTKYESLIAPNIFVSGYILK